VIAVKTGDARALVHAIPDKSIDCIFTDPVYDRIADYHWLATTAARVLKPHGVCLVWFATKHLKPVLDALCPPLHYRWQLVEIQVFSGIKAGTSVISSRHNDCLWLELAPDASRAHTRIWDVSTVSKKERPRVPIPRNGFAWSKHPNTVKRWLEAFTQPGDHVLDPFTGHGTVPALCQALGRRCTAFEINPERATRARDRVAGTQPPLFAPNLSSFSPSVKNQQPSFVL